MHEQSYTSTPTLVPIARYGVTFNFYPLFLWFILLLISVSEYTVSMAGKLVNDYLERMWKKPALSELR
jgi:hypothetical protein